MNHMDVKNAIFDLVGDNYYPNKPLSVLKGEHASHELVFLDFLHTPAFCEWKPGSKWKREFPSAKYNGEVRDHKGLSFNHHSEDKFCSVYFDNASPDQVIIPKKYQHLFKEGSIESKLAELGIGVTWIIVPENFLIDAIPIIKANDEAKKIDPEKIEYITKSKNALELAIEKTEYFKGFDKFVYEWRNVLKKQVELMNNYLGDNFSE